MFAKNKKATLDAITTLTIPKINKKNPNRLRQLGFEIYYVEI